MDQQRERHAPVRRRMGRARAFGIALCLGVALCAGASLGVLRSGRPLYYSDGSVATRADALAEAPMLVWGRAEAEVELPGPVVGRVQPLPDGRLLYGRGIDERRTDLVVFDPTLPELAPVPLSAVNSPGHDFAPALAVDGSLWFTSDRRGGAGGFDLWRAVSLGGGRFAVPIAVDGEVNTPADETDPAPSADGDSLVFVRRLRSEADGKNGRLWIQDRSSLDPPRPVFDVAPSLREKRGMLAPVIVRDPTFAPDGAALWFVRERAGAPASLMVSHRHRDDFAAPVAMAAVSAGRALRAPALVDDGFGLLLVQGGDAPLLLRARGRLVYPWWAGQVPLENLLAILLAASLLLATLLLLGARWRQLDIVTWCLLISLLLHLLIYLWLQGLEIMTPDELPGAGGDRLALRVVAAGSVAGGAQSATAAGSDTAAVARVSERLQRVTTPGELEVARPTTAVGMASPAEVSATVPTAGERARSASLPLPAESASTPAAPTLGDRPKAIERASAADATLANLGDDAGAAELAAPSVATEAPRSERSPRDTGDGEVVVERPTGTAVAAARSTAASSVPPAPSGARRVDETSLRERRVAVAPVGQLADAVEGARPVAASGSDPALAPVVAMDLAASAPSASGSAVAAPQRQLLEPEGSATGGSLDVRPASRLAAAEGVAVPAARRSRSDAASVAEGTLGAVVAAPRLDDRPAGGVAEASVERSSADPSLASAVGDLEALVAADPVTGEAALQRPGRASALAAPDAGSIQLPASSLASTSVGAVPRASRRRPRGSQSTTIDLPALADLRDASDLDDEVPDQGTSASRRSGADPDLVALGEQVSLPGLAPSGHRRELRAPTRAGGESRSDGAGIGGIRPPETGLVAAPGRLPGAAARRDRDEPLPGLYANRFGPRKAEALERFGGTAETEAAVQRGLAYLASRQDEAGRWVGRRDLDRKYGETWIGRSGLCLLAFLGANHTHTSGSEYSPLVARGLAALLAEQDRETGHFGRTSSYSHGITTYALAECLAMTGDERLREPLERAVAWIVRNQERGRDPRSRGGWGYFSPVLRAEDDYARTSVSAWMIMALESARISEVEVPDAVLANAREFLLRKFDERRGYFLYSEEPDRLRSSWRTLPASTPIASFCLMLLGEDPRAEHLRRAVDYTLARRPREWERADDDAFVLRGEGNPYFWYAGTLACFLAGGDAWKQWNAALQDVALGAQRRDGSFPPVGAYARYAGDSDQDACFTTALGVLSLEVYYRYFTPLLDGR